MSKKKQESDWNSEDDPELTCGVCGDPIDGHFHVDPETGIEYLARCRRSCPCGDPNCRGSGAI